MARIRVLYTVAGAVAALALLIPYVMFLQQRGEEHGNSAAVIFTLPAFFILIVGAVLVRSGALRWWGAVVLGLLLLLAHAIAVVIAGGALFLLGAPLACTFGCAAEDAARYAAKNRLAATIGFAGASLLGAALTLLPLTRFGSTTRSGPAWRIALLAPPLAAAVAAGLAWVSPQGNFGYVTLIWVYALWQLPLAAGIAGMLAAHTPLRRWFFWSKPTPGAPATA